MKNQGILLKQKSSLEIDTKNQKDYPVALNLNQCLYAKTALGTDEKLISTRIGKRRRLFSELIFTGMPCARMEGASFD